MIKAAFFDIDGTLLSFKTHRVSEGTVCAFERLRQRGVKTFISSGRPMALIPEMPVRFDGYVTMNGGYTFVDDHVLVSNPIPKTEVDHWLDYADAHNLCTILFGKKDMLGTHINQKAIDIRNKLEFTMPEFADMDRLRDMETFQIIAIMGPERDAEVAELLPHCRIPRWCDDFSDIVFHANSKALGIKAVLDHFDISREECIGFGDGGNDVEMLDYCGIGVAMGNAADDVKKHADFVTSSVDEEGIENALIQLGII